MDINPVTSQELANWPFKISILSDQPKITIKIQTGSKTNILSREIAISAITVSQALSLREHISEVIYSITNNLT